MKIIKNINEKIKEETVICIGSFDGLHIGHKYLIDKTIKEAKDRKIKSAVFTFSNHPSSIIPEKEEPRLIVNSSEKKEIFRESGIDYLIMIDFNKEFMEIEPVEFVEEILLKKFKAKKVIVGFNYRFGHKGKGDIDLLRSLSQNLNFEVNVVSPVKKEGEIISSSKIRELLLNSDIKTANNFLGRNFSVKGKVVHGKKRGKDLGFPTANINLNDNYIVPINGVYKTKTIYNSKTYDSLTNVGINPTFERDKNISIETYILNFNKDIYDKNIKVEFIDFIRKEKKFKNKEDLVEQMNLDLKSVIQ